MAVVVIVMLLPAPTQHTEPVTDLLKVHQDFMPPDTDSGTSGRAALSAGGASYATLEGGDPVAPAPEWPTFEAHGAVWPEYLRTWVDYAAERKCLLTEGYSDILSDLEPFRKKGVTRAWLRRTFKSLDELNYCKVRSGTIDCSNTEVLKVPNTADANFQAYLKLLPDMDFVLNIDDSPRLMVPNPADHGRPAYFDWSVDSTIQARCSNESGILGVNGLHTAMIAVQPTRTSERLPIFSPGVIDGCHRDIVLPPWMARMTIVPGATAADTRDPAGYLNWEDKSDTVLWTGRTTGSAINDHIDWRNSQRFRLVKMMNEPGAMPDGIEVDVTFAGVVQCELDPAACAAICDEYACKIGGTGNAWEFGNVWNQYSAKYIIDVDGNAWTERFDKLLYGGARPAPSVDHCLIAPCCDASMPRSDLACAPISPCSQL